MSRSEAHTQKETLEFGNLTTVVPKRSSVVHRAERLWEDWLEGKMEQIPGPSALKTSWMLLPGQVPCQAPARPFKGRVEDSASSKRILDPETT